MKAVSFVLRGKTKPKQSARFTKNGIFIPSKVCFSAQYIKACALKHFPVPFIGPVAMCLVFTYKAGKSNRHKYFKTTRPDVVNLQKNVEDALNGLAYVDDSQVAMAYQEKCWGKEDTVLVAIIPLEDQRP